MALPGKAPGPAPRWSAGRAHVSTGWAGENPPFLTPADICVCLLALQSLNNRTQHPCSLGLSAPWRGDGGTEAQQMASGTLRIEQRLQRALGGTPGPNLALRCGSHREGSPQKQRPH